MNSKRTSLEIIAPSIEEAIEKGLAELGLPPEAVEIETLDEGSRGLFGIGSRQARIRLTIKSQAEEDMEAESSPEPGIYVQTIPSEPLQEDKATPKPTISEDLQLHLAREIITELLENMHVTANVNARFGDPDESQVRTPILVDILGDDLSILIGRRGETLNALQYIASLILSKELNQRVTLVIDIEGYRTRREAQVRQLARRMADQAVKTGRRQALEPMPANERRIVHMELRDYPEVRTESSGEDPHRKVNIIPAE